MHTPSSIIQALALLGLASVRAAPTNPIVSALHSNSRTPGVIVSMDGPNFHADAPVSNPSTGTYLAKRETGRIEVHWEFSDIASEIGACGDSTCTSTSPSDHLWVDWYANGASSPTCSDYWDITVDNGIGNGVNGKAYYSQRCDIYAIFDGPNPNDGAVETYSSGHGADCGWVSSPDHTGPWWLIGDTNDYYHHCSW